MKWYVHTSGGRYRHEVEAVYGLWTDMYNNVDEAVYAIEEHIKSNIPDIPFRLFAYERTKITDQHFIYHPTNPAYRTKPQFTILREDHDTE